MQISGKGKGITKLLFPWQTLANWQRRHAKVRHAKEKKTAVIFGNCLGRN
jgi:hypothetical protein